MNKLVLFVSLMIAFCGSYAEIYKWTDSQGNVYFSDVPHEGAEKITIPDAQSYSPPDSKPSLAPKNKSEDKKQRRYSKIEITQPENQATVRSNLGYVVIAVQIEPELAPNDKLQLIFDGSPLGEPQPSLSFQLNGVYRGSHTIAVQVLDPNGEVLKTSESNTFFMHKTQIGKVGGEK